MDERLFPYQKVGAEWLTTKKNALLADEMGLGKSAQAITASDTLQAKCMLVLCPAVARLNWMNQFHEFSERASTLSLKPIFSETDIQPLTERPFTNGGVICSYNLMTNKKVSTWISSIHWNVLILDEAHYLSNRRSQRTRAVFGDLHKNVDYTWALTGTPMTGHANGLWVLLHYFGQYLGDFWTFARRFCTWYEYRQEACFTGTLRVPELRALLAPIMLRRRKKDVAPQLPPLIYSVYPVEAGEVDMKRWYPQLETNLDTPEGLNKKLEEERAAIDAVVNITGLGEDGITALGRLQKRCRLSRRYTGLQKVDSVVELITGELRSGAYDKKVIFCYHKAVVEDLWEKLKEFKPVIIYGGTPAKKKYKREQQFKKDPKCKLLIANIEAAGIAIDLIVAHHVDIVESDWRPDKTAQAIMRTHRHGQEHPVNVRFYYLPNSTDEKVQRVIRTKVKITTEILDPVSDNDDPFEGLD